MEIDIDVLGITDSKLGESFPSNQFILEDYHTPYRLDVTDKNGGLIVFIKSHIPSRRLTELKFHLTHKLGIAFELQ